VLVKLVVQLLNGLALSRMFALFALLAQLLAASASLRKNSKRLPWYLLLPLLVTTLMEAPPARPVSAL
jgi:hypothetical protein